MPVQTVVFFNISDEITVLWRASRALEKKIDTLKEQRHTMIPEVITGQERVPGAKESGAETRGQKRALSSTDEQLRISKELHPDTVSPSPPKRSSPSHESPISPESPSPISTSGPVTTTTPLSFSVSFPNLLPPVSTSGLLPTTTLMSSSFTAPYFH